MTKEFPWFFWLELTFLAAPFLMIIIGFVLNIYLGSRHLHTMVEALKNCRHIAGQYEGLRHQGWFGRVLIVGRISSAVLWPRPLIRIGEVSPEDIKNFPARLKRLITLHMGLLIIAISLLALGYLARN